MSETQQTLLCTSSPRESTHTGGGERIVHKYRLVLLITYQAAHKQGAHRLPLCVAPQIHFQGFLSNEGGDVWSGLTPTWWTRRSRIRKETWRIPGDKKQPGFFLCVCVSWRSTAGEPGGLPVSDSPLKRPSAQKPRVLLSLRFHPHLSSFIADDVCVCQEPGRPNPLPVRIRDCGAMLTHKLLGIKINNNNNKRHQSGVAQAYLDWPPGQRQKEIWELRSQADPSRR